MKNGGFESSPVFFLWLKLSSNFWSFVWWTQLGSLVQAAIKQKDWMWTQCHCCGTIMCNQEATECYYTCLIPLPSNSVIYSIVFMVWGISVSTLLFYSYEPWQNSAFTINKLSHIRKIQTDSKFSPSLTAFRTLLPVYQIIPPCLGKFLL